MKFYIPVLLLVLAGCNNAATDQKSGQNRADSIKDQVLQAHNVAMARMEKISGQETRVKQVMDSLSKLTGIPGKNVVSYRSQLESVLTRLQSANASMESWMDDFNMDSLENDPEKRVQYLQSEQGKINAIKDSMQISLADVDALLKKR